MSNQPRVSNMAERDEVHSSLSWESLSDVMSNSGDLLEATKELGGPDHNGTKPCFLHVSHLPSDITEKELVEVLQLRRESVKNIKICSLTGQADICLETGAGLGNLLQRVPLALKGKEITVKLVSDGHFHETLAPTVIQAHAEESNDIFQKDIFSSHLAQRAAPCVEPHLNAFVSHGQMKKLSSYGQLERGEISCSLQEKASVPENSMQKFQDQIDSFQESLSFIHLQEPELIESWPDLENDKDSSGLKPGLPVSQNFTFGSLPVSSNRREMEMAETDNQSKMSQSRCFSQIQDSERFKMGHSIPRSHSAFVKSNMSSNRMLQNPVHRHAQEVPMLQNLRTETPYSSKNIHLSHHSESSGSYRHKGTSELYSESPYSTLNACEDPSSNFGHMKHKSSDWHHASPFLESSEQTSTVVIRNVQDESYAAMCVYYFGNPLQGGGKIKEHNWNEQESTLYITFEDPFVASQVASSSHTVGKKTVEMSLYHPSLKFSPDRCTVEVKGIDPSLEEMYELYFQNHRKSGGGEILNFQMKEDSQTLHITYKTSDVADMVVGRKHTLCGSTLHVSHYCPVLDGDGTDTNDTSTVQVCGIDPLCQDLYQLYFESPLKGGGTIKCLWLKEDNSVMYITFDSAEVAESVCSKKHVVRGHTLDVTRKLKTQNHGHDSTVKSTEISTKKSTFTSVPKVEEMEEAEKPLCTIEVKVRQQDLQNQENYLHYFENKRSGGGDVEKIWIDEEKGVIYITFTDSEAAERVACQMHIINGQSVEVKLYKPPKPRPTYANKLVLENVDEGASKESLVYFIENITGFEPKEMLYGDKPGVVLVTFDEEIDFSSTQEKCHKKKFENKFITVSKMPVSNCLLVKNLTPDTTEEMLTFYFESKRNSGGPVDQVLKVPNENMCLVYFKDYKDAEIVLTKSHMINGNELIIKPYLECLGLSGGRPDPKFFVMPKPLVFDNIDPYKIAFVRQTASFCNDFFQHLHSVNARPTFTNDSLTVECTLTVSIVNARTLASTWPKEVEKHIHQELDRLEVCRTEIIQEIWPMAESAVKEFSSSKKDSAVLFIVPDKYSIIVVGLRDKAKKLFEHVNGIVQHVEEEVQRKKTEITETNRNLKSHQLILLEEKSFPSEVEKKYEGLSVKIRTDQPDITFHGVLKDVKEAQIEMLTLLNDVKSDKATGVSENKKLLLTKKETRDYIQQKFRFKKIVAVWEHNADNIINVYAFSDFDLKSALKIFTQSLVEHVQSLSSESAELTLSEAFKKLISTILSKHPGTLQITPMCKEKQILVVGIDSIILTVLETLVNYLQENTVYTEILCFSPSQQKFVWLYWKEKLTGICNHEKQLNVKVSLINEGKQIKVMGTEKGLEWAKEKLESLQQQIVCHRETLTDQGQVKFVSSENCAKDLKKLAESKHCIISLTKETSGLQVVKSNTHKETLANQEQSIIGEDGASITLPSGVTVLAMKTDIALMSVDVIINAANERMDHCGGLALHIVDKGGRSIQEECTRIMKTQNLTFSDGDILVTESGRLPCKAIIHAVGPKYRNGNKADDDCLHDLVIKCLEATQRKRFSSIAFPAISAGIFGFPVDRSTSLIVKAVKTYLDSASHRSSIKRICFCDISVSTIAHFTTAMQNIFPEFSTSRYPFEISRPFENEQETLPFSQPTKLTTSYGYKRQQSFQHRQPPKSSSIINIDVIKGKIAEQKVDVIVNSASSNLQLSSGAVSSSILSAAGNALQVECSTRYPQGINVGQVAQTSGHGLSCTMVLHLAICKWDGPTSEKVLTDGIIECLKISNKNGYTTIAFPPLGTGILGFPRETVADIVMDAVHKFELKTLSPTLKNVIVVVYNDALTFQAFEKACSSKFVPQQGRRRHRAFDSIDSARYESNTQAEFKIADLRLLIKQGDITQENVHAIVNSTNSTLDLSKGAVALALMRICGDQLQKECTTKVEEIKRKGIAITKAYELPCKKIVHLNSEKFNDDWESGIKMLLEVAESEKIYSLAMPALGTGVYGLSMEKSAEHLLTQLVTFCSKKRKFPKEVHVVLFDRNMLEPFIKTIQDKQDTSSPGFLKYVRSLFLQPTPKVEQKVWEQPKKKQVTGELYIFTDKKMSIPEILDDFNDLVKEKIMCQEIKDEILMNMTTNEIQEMQQVGKVFNLDVEVFPHEGRIVVSGLKDGVITTSIKIGKMLRDALKKQKTDEAALMLANTVQWCFLEVNSTGTEKKEYGQRENHLIERAFQSKERSTEIIDSAGTIYVIDFNTMTEFPKHDTSDIVNVMRTSKNIGGALSGEVPPTWTVHTNKESVKLVPLKKTDQEFKAVETNFFASLRKLGVTIINVERVQNPTLFSQYQAKKVQLEIQNPGHTNEKLLWHGTSSDTPPNINLYGFNRSYCGKNATQYGQGVYFAVNSAYSAQPTYSPPNPSTGNRYMYQCRVLVGHTAQGNHHVRFLPPRSGVICYDSASDNPANPGIYVIFNDTQAYPEYLITFQ